jgi:hypothetical protein
LDEVAFGLFKREKVYEQWRVSREQE